jgi:hypothetical protein
MEGSEVSAESLIRSLDAGVNEDKIILFLTSPYILKLIGEKKLPTGLNFRSARSEGNEARQKARKGKRRNEKEKDFLHKKNYTSNLEG